MTIDFGRAARALWSLHEGSTFLNHGSFGAIPIAVQREQERIRREMEEAPDRFFFDQIMPRDGATALREAAREIGGFMGAGQDEVAFVENATTGIQSVLQSIALEAGDEILLTDHQYAAVRFAIEKRCRETGALPRIAAIPIPTTPEEIASRIVAAANERTRLAVIDHITSPTALVFPIERIVAALRDRGIAVLVDGAHAIGQVELDVAAIDADWYVTNAHKWLFAPRGTALLHASARVAGITNPVITSHFIGSGFPASFDYLGTRDNSAWLAAPAALAFFRDLDPVRLRSYIARLIDAGSLMLGGLGAMPAGPRGMAGAMRAFILPQRRPAEPQDGPLLRDGLRREEGIYTAAYSFGGALLIRISAQAYVDEEDLARLAGALDRRGWPGR